MQVKVMIQSVDLRNFLETEKDYWDRFGSAVLTTVRDKGLQIYQEEAPKGATRRLQRSLFGEVQGNKVSFGYDLSVAPHAEHIDGYGQTARSQGRFVPTLGRRLIKSSKHNPSVGWHPGSRKTPFTERTLARLGPLMTNIIMNGIQGAPK